MNPNDENNPLFEKKTEQAKNTENEKNHTLKPGYSYHVFLSHNSKHKSLIENLKTDLESVGLLCWYDQEKLQPGKPFQPLLEDGIRKSQSVIVAIGSDGLGKWQDLEIQTLLTLVTEPEVAIIPLLLPDANPSHIPVFLKSRTFIYLDYEDQSSLETIIWGITGNRSTPQNKEQSNKFDNSSLESSELIDTPTRIQSPSIDQTDDTNEYKKDCEITICPLDVETTTKLILTQDGLGKIESILADHDKPEEKKHLISLLLIIATTNPATEAYRTCESLLKRITEYDESIVENALSSDRLLGHENVLILFDLLQSVGAPLELVVNTAFISNNKFMRKQMACWLERTGTEDPQTSCWLLTELEKETDDEVKKTIKNSLGIARRVNVDKLGNYLKSASIDVVEQTLGMLTRTSGELRGSATEGIVTLALKSENFNLRGMARELLNRISVQETHRLSIEDQLEKSSDSYQIWAMELLLALPKDELTRFEDRIASNLQSNNLRARLLALYCVGKLGPESYCDQIAALAIDKNAKVASYALYLLFYVDKKSASIYNFLVRNFDDIQPKGILVRLLGFFNIADPAVINVLRRAIQGDYETEVRIGALISLSKIDPDLVWVYNAMISFASQSDSTLHPRIYLCFAELSRRDDSVFVKLFEELLIEDMCLPILLFLQAAPDIAYRASSLLPSLLDSDDARIKKASLELLAVIGFCDDEVLAKCHQMLRSHDKEIVMPCLKALAVVGDQKSMIEIQSLFVNSKICVKNKKEWRWKTRVFKKKKQKNTLLEDIDVQTESLSALYLLRKKCKNGNHP